MNQTRAFGKYTEYIQLAHGGGGKLSHDLVNDIIVKAFKNPILETLHDGAEIIIGGVKLAFTTDSYVVKPRFFPGGDIGKLAVFGTVNDLAMSGAEPLFLSVGFVLEEGFSMDEFGQIVSSMANAAVKAKVEIVTGDTKVVEKGAVDGIFINTAGVGKVFNNAGINASRVKPGQEIIVSGYLGDHAIAVMSERHGLSLPETVESDCAPLNSLVKAIFEDRELEAGQNVVMLRDPTRGGLATTLNEIAAQAGTGILINEESLPIKPAVQAVCDILGFDPLYLANEGKLIAVVEKNASNKLLEIMHSHPLGRNARIIGSVSEQPAGQVGLVTCIGGIRLLDMLTGEQLPRIC